MGDQSVRTMVKTLIFSKYFVGSGANPMHTHVVVKSLLGVKELFAFSRRGKANEKLLGWKNLFSES